MSAEYEEMQTKIEAEKKKKAMFHFASPATRGMLDE